VSSFGLSGTNAHVIIAEPPDAPESAPVPATDTSAAAVVAAGGGGVMPWVVSGRGAAGLAAQARRLAAFTAGRTGLAPVDVGMALAGRAVLEDRAVIVGAGTGELVAGVAAVGRGEAAPGVVTGQASVGAGKVAFVFAGPGSQWPGMAAELLDDCPVFAARMAECRQALAPHVGWDLAEVIRGVAGAPGLDTADVAKPALWAVTVSLAALWQAAGVVPDVVAGHSQGEIAAATVAGVLSLADAAKVVTVRSQVPGGLAGIRPGRARVPVVSTVTGQLIDSDQMDEEYWYRNLREAVQFQQVVTVLAGLGVTAFAEVSPHPVLAAGIKQTLAELATPGEAAVVTGSLCRGEGGLRRFALSLAQLYVRGVSVDWSRWFAGSGAQAVGLPTYAFQHQRCWPQHRPAPAAAVWRGVESLGLEAAGHPLLGAVVELPDGQEAVLTGWLSVATQPWLADHVVMGRVLLAGTAFVELAVRAGDAVGCAVLEELTLQAPLVLSADGAVQVQVQVARPDESGRRAVRIYSRPRGQSDGEGWSCHATGVLAGDHAGQAGEAVDFTAWPPPGAAPVPVERIYGRLAEAGLGYGPAFQGLTGIWRRGEEVFAEARLSGQAEADAGSFGLHPALLDAVLHAVGAGQSAGAAGPVRPISWSEVLLHATGAVVLRARLAPSGPDGISLLAADEAGELVLSARRLVLRPVPSGDLASARPRAAAGLFAQDWVPVPVRPGARAAGWVVIGDDGGQLATGLGAARYLDLTELAAAVAAGAATPAAVAVPVAASPWADPGAEVGTLAGQVLKLVQRWLAEDRLAQARLVVLTCGAVAAATGDRVTDLPAAAARGLIRSAQSENPGRLVLIDLDEPGLRVGTDLGVTLADALASGEPELAVRGGRVLARRLVPATSTTRPGSGELGSRPAARAHGAVLITGGTGVLGALVARHLAVCGQARRLVLVGRPGPAGPGAARLAARLAGLGTAALVAACDADDRSALAALMVHQTRGPVPLTGVVHAAGGSDDEETGSPTAERVQQVSRPKAAAAWYLHELTMGTDLNQFILFSSAAGMLGGTEQGNHAAGDAFLDALAQFRRDRGLPAVSLAWSPRAQSTGMTMNPAAISEGRAAPESLSSREALALLDAARDQDQPALLPARFDTAMLRAAAAHSQLPALLRSLVPGQARRTAWHRRVRPREGWRYRNVDGQP
jgi:acyl transferase domain-containing protein